MAGRFYTEPSNIMPGLQMLGRGLETRALFERERVKSAKAEKLRQKAMNVFQAGDPDAIVDFIGRNPGAKDIYAEMVGANQKIMVDEAKRWLIDNEDPIEMHIQKAEQKAAAGEDISGDVEDVKAIMSDYEGEKKQREMILAMYDKTAYDSYKSSIKTETEGMLDVAGIKEFEYLTSGLSPEELTKAKRIKLGLAPRATESAVKKAEKAFATESGKLQAKYKLEPKVAGAVTAAKNEAAARVKEAGTAKSNQTAWNVYNESMSNLSKAMGGTETGPFVGFIPAITENQQIAEGAVAVMAPVLKQMFRAAGEGVFTDKDQELLMKMVPTRTDHAAARVAKIKAIDAVVRAKLGIEEDAPTPKTEKDIKQMTDEELTNIALGG